MQKKTKTHKQAPTYVHYLTVEWILVLKKHKLLGVGEEF